MTDQLYKNHAKNERDLASLVAQETLQDIYGDEERTYNVPALLLGLVFILVLLAGFSGLVYLIVRSMQ